MTTATTPGIRRFTLEKYSLSILFTLTTEMNGDTHSYWEVRLGDQRVKEGIAERVDGVADVLRSVLASTTMRTSALDMTLHATAWQALDGCEHVPASELRAGDRIILGGAVARTVDSVNLLPDGAVLITLREVPVTRRFPRTHLCNLLARGPQA